MSAAGKETVLYSFLGSGDGSDPSGTLLIDAVNNLYGITEAGGTNNLGTVFKLAPPATVGAAWTESILHSFAGGTKDGEIPRGGLVMDSKGNFYGVTQAGGTNDDGTVFKLDASGKASILFSFTNGKEGGGPVGRLVIDSKQKYLYGTASTGGDNLEGTVFRVPVP